MSNLLEMRKITKTFPGVKALDEVDFSLERGTVHALMGENGAGKSTLMKCLFGIYTPDSGEIYIDGKKVSYKDPKDALDSGVAMVHQELNQVSMRSVAENIMLGRFPNKYGIVDAKKMNQETQDLFDKLGLNFDPKKIIGKYSVAERQLIEIAKAVSYDAKILVLDEPTSSLTESEVDKLFEIINKLRKQGVGIIYISHKMEEILSISDFVTVMRDGKFIDCKPASELSKDEIIKLMVGRKIDASNLKTDEYIKDEVMLEVKNLTGKYKPTVTDISFDLKKGEILGIAGLVGSRRTELVETIFGLRQKASGQIFIHGKEVENKDPIEAIKNGFALVTEERRATGIFPYAAIRLNATIANIKKYAKHSIVSDKALKEDTNRVIESMEVKTPSQSTKIMNLSGGNQQKVIIGRWLLTDPDVLLLDEPTRGIDVGAKYEIYKLIGQLAKEGKSVLFISSEMAELQMVCNRIMVMSNGRLAGIEKNDENLTQEKIMALQAKYV
ncbi:ABC transporter, ATP-binding protein [Anaerococcus lactolyticus ATCC 51172]|uniref:Ribose/galactose/methyl galactoside import ATP-binding protein n=1 Tax=Anaerococcus lactolyticus ATCC 51172 TaxID=525254 RepID=C2BGG3_9FIRM|nr:sugar ABC transporter ATP-binding protein [Anaerococcus lactolyticus]EEI86090.1 ABC transporter, ATP-binding protein [Anaerococcus lactolyticus ATCC 51172]